MENSKKRDKDQLSFLLKLAGNMIDSLIQGLDLIDPETRKRIMELCGKACAREEFFGSALAIAKRIGEKETDMDKILERANEEILWCGMWERNNNMVICSCRHCGCPLAEHNVVKLRETFCYCSLGWIKSIFDTLFNKDVRVDLEKAIGFGDKECRFVVYI